MLALGMKIVGSNGHCIDRMQYCYFIYGSANFTTVMTDLTNDTQIDMSADVS